MGRKNLLITVTSIISLVISGGFISSPVFAESPVDIELIEIVDDGSGSYKPWENITDAMPGETYSLIPRIISYGEAEVSVNICMVKTGQDSSGNPITIPEDTFIVNTNSHWLPDEQPNCYKYDSTLSTDEISEPFFEEVTINSAISNEYQNATFNLTLIASGSGDIPDSPNSPDDNQPEESDSTSTPTASPTTPNSPDTGANTFTSSVLPTISIIAVIIALGAIIIFKKKTK